jgi:hypothetical protein
MPPFLNTKLMEYMIASGSVLFLNISHTIFLKIKYIKILLLNLKTLYKKGPLKIFQSRIYKCVFEHSYAKMIVEFLKKKTV